MSRKVLVVDDEKLIVKGIRFSLEQDGMDVDCAYDGEEALKLIRENKYNIILLDVMLPKLDGFQVCQQVREFSERQTEERPEGRQIVKGDMKIDCEGRRVVIGEREVNLTAKEFDLLELLAMNQDKVYSRENLLNIVWGYEYPGDARTVDVHIRRLREKIEKNPSDPKYVHTKWGVGYYFRG